MKSVKKQQNHERGARAQSSVARELRGIERFDAASSKPVRRTFLSLLAGTAFSALGLTAPCESNAQVVNGTGAHANATGSSAADYGVAIGDGANADSSAPAGSSPVAIGIASNASGAGSQVAIGDLARATGTNAVAIGGHPYSAGTSATGDFSVAIGASSMATGYGALAFGGDASSGASAAGQYALAFGARANAAQANSTAIGTGAKAAFANDVALGSGSVTAAAVGTSGGSLNGIDYAFAGATPTSSVSIGDVGAERTMTNMAAGRVSASSTDAVNGSQLNATNLALAAEDAKVNQLGDGMATALGGGAAFDAATGTVSMPSYAVHGSMQNGLGAALEALQNNAPLQYSTAAAPTTGLGAAGAPVSNDVTLVGPQAGAPVALHNVAAGVAATDAVNVSQLASLGQSTASGLGGNSAYDASTNTLSAPAFSVHGTSENSVGAALEALQNNAPLQYSTAASPVTGLGAAGAPVSNDVTLVGPDARAPVTLHNVAEGVSATDAVNGSQLHAVADSVAKGLGGGAAVSGDGTMTAPAYALSNANAIAGTTGAAGDVGSGMGKIDAALGSLNTAVVGNTTSISALTNQIQSGQIGLVQQDAATRNIIVAQDSDGAEVDFTGTAGARRLTGVANGSVSGSSKQAVNGSQLYGLASSTAAALGGGATVNSDGSLTAPAYSINSQTFDNVGSALTNLDGRTTQNTSDIATLNSNVAQNTADITNLSSNVAQNTSDIATLNSNVAQNTADITNLSSNVAQNTVNIAKNTSDIASITNQISSGTVGLVQQDPTSKNIAVARDRDGMLVDMTGTQGTRTVTGVSAGALTPDSKDAVNGSQLYQTNVNVANLTQRVDTVEIDTSVLASQSHDTPAVATGAGSTAIGNGANASGKNAVALGAGSVADEANTVSLGSQGNERRLTNVASAIKGTDAVNLNQLSSSVGNLQNQITDNLKKSYGGAAAAIAIAGLHYDDRPGKISAAAATGYYHNQMGLAMGVGGTSGDGRWRVNGGLTVSTTLSSPDVGAVLGVSHTLN